MCFYFVISFRFVAFNDKEYSFNFGWSWLHDCGVTSYRLFVYVYRSRLLITTWIIVSNLKLELGQFINKFEGIKLNGKTGKIKLIY